MMIRRVIVGVMIAATTATSLAGCPREPQGHGSCEQLPGVSDEEIDETCNDSGIVRDDE